MPDFHRILAKASGPFEHKTRSLKQRGWKGGGEGLVGVKISVLSPVTSPLKACSSGLRIEAFSYIRQYKPNSCSSLNLSVGIETHLGFSPVPLSSVGFAGSQTEPKQEEKKKKKPSSLQGCHESCLQESPRDTPLGQADIWPKGLLNAPRQPAAWLCVGKKSKEPPSASIWRMGIGRS